MMVVVVAVVMLSLSITVHHVLSTKRRYQAASDLTPRTVSPPGGPFWTRHGRGHDGDGPGPVAGGDVS